MGTALAGVLAHRGVFVPAFALFIMNVLSTLLLALAMSTDAFAAAIGKGAALHKPPFREALRTGLIFGVIEGLTPVIGWAMGLAAASYVKAWDHWIAVTMLSLLGLRMIHAGMSTPESEEEKPSKNSFWNLAVTGFATSIDAMAVGVGLAFLNVNIAATAVAIGLATTVVVTTGVMLGRVLGTLVGRRAEIFGGMVLIGIGFLILYEHTNGLA